MMLKLLIADDDANLRDFLKEELTNAGFTVTTVGNGADVIVKAAEQPFDMILIDMLMPGLDGIQVIRVLRKITPSIPIIGLTGYVGRGYMAQAMDLDVTTLTKPIVVPELIKEINDTLKTNKK
ncbi:MAG: response regulator [Anaerolineales bacterium]|nr:response regulator [Anaerolineales bacterium]